MEINRWQCGKKKFLEINVEQIHNGGGVLMLPCYHATIPRSVRQENSEDQRLWTQEDAQPGRVFPQHFCLAFIKTLACSLARCLCCGRQKSDTGWIKQKTRSVPKDLGQLGIHTWSQHHPARAHFPELRELEGADIRAGGNRGMTGLSSVPSSVTEKEERGWIAVLSVREPCTHCCRLRRGLVIYGMAWDLREGSAATSACCFIRALGWVLSTTWLTTICNTSSKGLDSCVLICSSYFVFEMISYGLVWPQTHV